MLELINFATVKALRELTGEWWCSVDAQTGSLPETSWQRRKCEAQKVTVAVFETGFMDKSSATVINSVKILPAVKLLLTQETLHRLNVSEEK